ncbi:MAG TPA: nucleoside kinase [Firmicutes bacterium]|nr:nucleoside kinase [Bacillota bacterium]
MKKDHTTTVKVTVSPGITREVPPGTTILELIRDLGIKAKYPIVLAKVNNELRELTAPITSDCTVEFLDMSHEDGMRVYRRSVVFILVRAAREILPGCRVRIEHSLSNGLYGEIFWQRPLTEKDVMQIEARMRAIVEEDVPFTKERLPKEKAIQIFKEDGQYDKVHLLKYRKAPTVNVYSCGWLRDYFYGYMVPSSGYLKYFKLRFYLPGFIIEFPRTEDPVTIPDYVEQGKLAGIYFEAEKWANILGVADVASFNDIVEAGEAGTLIRVSEAFHERKIAKIADVITQERERLRVVLIAGPSSSGKTTFAQRLMVELRVNGLEPVTISLDDYFVDRETTARGEDGTLDFESLEAIDIELFNEDLSRLIQGEEIDLPTFNFITGRREYTGRKLRVSRDQPIIIEGIHGLNDKLTRSIPKGRKFKIYVSALTQLNIDDHNRIPTTDVRLIRRIVRDNQFRGHDAASTIRMWPSVRRGEERNIFPFQEEADVMFNSALPYELGVLKGYVQPLLEGIGKDQPEYSEAKRLLKFLEYFSDIDSREVPQNSILREFIGGSCFYRHVDKAS